MVLHGCVSSKVRPKKVSKAQVRRCLAPKVSNFNRPLHHFQLKDRRRYFPHCYHRLDEYCVGKHKPSDDCADGLMGATAYGQELELGALKTAGTATFMEPDIPALNRSHSSNE